MILLISLILIISTHSLTRRLTKAVISVTDETGNFNSQPHKEADSNNNVRTSRKNEFQLTASQGG